MTRGAVPGLQDGRPQDGALHLQDGGERVLGIQQADWDDAPALSDKNRSVVIKGRQYDLYYSGSRLHMIALRAGGASYWVVNTLLDTLSNETMLEIAGLRPMHK